MEPGNQSSIFKDLLVTHSMGDHIHETTKWTRFLAIVVIIGLSLILLLVIVAGSTIAPTVTTAFSAYGVIEGNLLLIIAFVFFLVFGALAFFLLRFAIYTRRGLELRNQSLFNEGLKALKIYFIIYGVFTILSVLANASSLLSR